MTPKPSGAFEGLGNGQYALLREEYTADLDDDILVLDDEAFLRVRLEDASDAHVTLGWELERRRGVWLTSRWYWHDLRPAFHPGIGEEECALPAVERGVVAEGRQARRELRSWRRVQGEPLAKQIVPLAPLTLVGGME